MELTANGAGIGTLSLAKFPRSGIDFKKKEYGIGVLVSCDIE